MTNSGLNQRASPPALAVCAATVRFIGASLLACMVLLSSAPAVAADVVESRLYGSDKKPLSQSDFAKLMAKYLKPGEIQDAKFLFQECFGGGMVSALKDTLGDSIKWIAGSASAADQPSYGPPDPTTEPDRWTKPLAEELKNKDQKMSDTLKSASDKDIRGPKGDKKEQPQTASSKDGGDIKMSDGKSHHAIIWTDKKDANRHDNDIKAIKDALTAAWAGAPGGTSITEVSTADELDKAMKKLKDDGKLNKDEEFLFYATGHGTRSTTVTPVKPGVGKNEIDIETLMIESGVLDAMHLSDPMHTAPQPTLSISYSGLATDDPVYFNGHLLGLLDHLQSETVFNLDLADLAISNEIEIRNNVSGSQDFVLFQKVFDTGSVNNATTGLPEPGMLMLVAIALLAGLGAKRPTRLR